MPIYNDYSLRFRVIQKDSERHVTEFVDKDTIKKLKTSIAASRAATQSQNETVED